MKLTYPTKQEEVSSSSQEMLILPSFQLRFSGIPNNYGTPEDGEFPILFPYNSHKNPPKDMGIVVFFTQHLAMPLSYC